MKTITLKEQKVGELVSRETINNIAKEIANRFNPEKIVLFGSYASNRENPDSDVDFLIVMESDLPHYQRSVPLQLMFRPMPCAVDFLIFTPEEVNNWNGIPNHIITEALKNGKIIYERKY